MDRDSSELVLTSEKDRVNTGIVQNNDSGTTLDGTLSYLSNMLMEENKDEEDIAVNEGTALQEMEKFFVDIIGQKYPPSEESSSIRYQTQPENYPICTNEPLQEKFNSILTSVPALEYNKGIEEGMKFLPSIENLTIDFQEKNLALSSPHSSTEEENDDQHIKDMSCSW